MNEGADLALRVVVPVSWAEVVGALLMERLGSYAEEPADSATGGWRVVGGVEQEVAEHSATGRVALVFYPREAELLSDSELMTLLPEEMTALGEIAIEREEVARDWVDGWKDHFHPLTIGRVRVRPPWEPPAEGISLIDVVIDPGLGFGTGLHPTTRGTLALLQEEAVSVTRGALVDVGTGSGILAVAAAKLGWGPIVAFDNDPVALTSARQNMTANRVDGMVEVRECGAEDAPLAWFAGATVLANMTLIPVLALITRVAGSRPARLVTSGILAGAQEAEVLREAEAHGLALRRRLYEAEWVSMELVSADDFAED